MLVENDWKDRRQNIMDKKEQISHIFSEIAQISLVAGVLILQVIELLVFFVASGRDLVVPIVLFLCVCFLATPVISLIMSIVAIIFNYKNKMAIITVVISVISILLILGIFQIAYYGMQRVAEIFPTPITFD